ncbi:response regulator [Azoarcus sp. KH32C]|uniref:hybrid sensor histidine kinase/response regulator n=1 Tax=Azoarcus sp. KH32C TaxID=748247 RepID=UPI000238603B|nr:response regulator [Azoarcus sp. KH32C]BAL25614.1 putative hybrid sensor and regulator protein [Azoarcus sp. KH32C]
MSLMNRLLPKSLVARVYALTLLTLLLFVSLGVGVFYRYQFRGNIQDAQDSATMIVEVVAQVIGESAAIGDYDTIKRTLDKAILRSPFESGAFIDLQGGVIRTRKSQPPDVPPPHWLRQEVAEQLYEVNRNIVVGGVDFGVLRLTFAVDQIAGDLWELFRAALGVAAASVTGGLLLIWLPLKRWLGTLERVQSFERDQAQGVDSSAELIDEVPAEFRHMFEVLANTSNTLRKELATRENAMNSLRSLLESILPANAGANGNVPDDIEAVSNLIRDLVTEREASRRALDNQKFALDQHAIVSITDRSGLITYANDRFCEISGYSREELVGTNHRLVNSGYHPPEFFADLWRTILSGRVWHGEIKNRAKGGSSFWVNATIVPLADADGKLSQFIAIRTDITERKRVEQELQDAKLAAEAANQAKSDFLANMSHEIRTPMNGIIGMTELVLDTALDTGQREHLEIVRSSAESLLVILNDILDFSKIEAGKLVVEHISFNLPLAISETLKCLAVRAGKKGLQLHCELSEDLPAYVSGDPGRLRQVLTNLCDNAIKFTDTGSITVRATTEAGDDRHCVIHVSVADTGIGIGHDQQKKVFAAFDQADTSTTRKFGGSGLGLTICSRLVGLMGGRIWLESEIGRGSTFHFTVDMQRVAGEGAVGEALPPLSTWPDVPALVADGDPAQRRSLAQWLRAWSFTVDEAADGHQALGKCRAAPPGECPYRVILIDSALPALDGFGFAEAMRNEGRSADVQMVMLSARGEKGDARRCRELGLAAYLSKPTTPLELRDTLTRVLAAREPDAVAGTEPDLVTRHTLKEHQRHLSILLVEDHPINQKLAAELFEMWGHRVTLAANGHEAVDLFPTMHWDIVFMDMQMPVMGGVEATRLIRASEPPGRRTPIIAMTASAMSEDRKRCLEAGMDDHIAKPIDRQAVHRLLEQYGARGGVALAAAPPPVVSVSPATIEAALDGLDPELVGVVGKVIAVHLPMDLAGAREASRRRSWPELRHAAHNMKSTFGLLGMTDLANIAQWIESNPEGTDKRTLDELQVTVDVIVNALSRKPGPAVRQDGIKAH